MSRLLRDPDMVVFISDLQFMPAGTRYRRAWDAQQNALKQVYALQGRRGNAEALEAARRKYIKCTQVASNALSTLNRVYDWPRGSNIQTNFTYRPKSRVLRRSRKSL